MANDVKFAILELNGEEFGGPNEHHAIAEEVYEDESLGRRTSDVLYSHPFIIGQDKDIIIPNSQQLINVDGFEIKGQLTIAGSLVI